MFSWLPDVIAGRPHAEPDPDALKPLPLDEADELGATDIDASEANVV
jgi:hypothetical protein